MPLWIRYDGLEAGGQHGDVFINDSAPLSTDLRFDRTDRLGRDGQMAGSDLISKRVWDFTLFTHKKSEDDALELAQAWENAWHDPEVRSGVKRVPLEYSRDRQTWYRVYGRPTLFTGPKLDVFTRQGRGQIDLQFEQLDPWHYSEHSEQVSIPVARSASGGIRMTHARRVTYEWAGVPHASEAIKLVNGEEVARNLVLNGTFEAGSSHWSTQGGSEQSISNGVMTLVDGSDYYQGLQKPETDAVVVFRARGESLRVRWGTWQAAPVTQLTDEYEWYSVALPPLGNQNLILSGDAQVSHFMVTLDLDETRYFDGDSPAQDFTGGIRVPIRVARSGGTVDRWGTNEGQHPAPVTVRFDGPVTDPEIELQGQWWFGVRGRLEWDEYLVVDPVEVTATVYSTTSNRSRAAYSMLRTGSRFSDLVMPPGQHAFTFRAVDPTFTAKVTATWPHTYASMQ